MFSLHDFPLQDDKSPLAAFEKRVKIGWQYYCERSLDQASKVFQEIIQEIQDFKEQKLLIKDYLSIEEVGRLELRLKLAIYFCLCRQADAAQATHYANIQRLFPPGNIQYDEILISNQALIANNTDSSKLVCLEYAAKFEMEWNAGNIGPTQIVSEQIFRDGNHRTAIWHIYLAEIKNNRIKNSTCDAYKLYAILARERYFQKHKRNPDGFELSIYQQQYANKRTYVIDGATASTMCYEKFLEVFRLDRFLLRLIGNGTPEGHRSFKHHFERHRQQGVASAHLLYNDMQFLDPPLAADVSLEIKRGHYEQWKGYYSRFIALGGAGGGDGANL